jgi:hypothetical protein
MAMGKAANRTIIVEIGRLRPYTDIGGRHVVRLDNTLPRRDDLARRLKTAGCPVDTSAPDWQTVGDFDSSNA